MKNVKLLEKEYDVTITNHNNRLSVNGDEADVLLAVKAIEGLILLIKKRREYR